MARHPSRYPTELELEVLKVLWREGPATVRAVRQALADFRDLAHTSVMTVMTIMTEKGYLKRRKKGRSYVYETRITEVETTGGMLTDLIDRVFAGSASAAVLNLLETSDLDEAELQKIQQILQQKAREDQA